MRMRPNAATSAPSVALGPRARLLLVAHSSGPTTSGASAHLRRPANRQLSLLTAQSHEPESNVERVTLLAGQTIASVSVHRLYARVSSSAPLERLSTPPLSGRRLVGAPARACALASGHEHSACRLTTGELAAPRHNLHQSSMSVGRNATVCIFSLPLRRQWWTRRTCHLAAPLGASFGLKWLASGKLRGRQRKSRASTIVSTQTHAQPARTVGPPPPALISCAFGAHLHALVTRHLGSVCRWPADHLRPPARRVSLQLFLGGAG